MQKYISISECGYGWFFEDPPVPKEDLTQIFPLSEDYCATLWTRNISNARHLQLAKKDEWVWKLKKIDYNFFDDWNNNTTTEFADFLRKHSIISTNDTIIYFMMREAAIETKFEVFLRNWINFLYEDEAPILFEVSTGFSIRFSSTGDVYCGIKA